MNKYRIVCGMLDSKYLWNVVDNNNNIMASFHGSMSCMAATSFLRDLVNATESFPEHEEIDRKHFVSADGKVLQYDED